MVPQRRYIVAATPRTGSYLLCGGLEATWVAGRPAEAFVPEFQHIWRRLWSLDRNAGFDQYFQAAIRHGTGSNGIYGLKIHWLQVGALARHASLCEPGADVLERLFPNSQFVNIVRRDRTAQALSYLRALQTNEWWHIDGVVNDQRNGAQPVFDAAAVRRLAHGLTLQQAAWEEYFAQRGIEPLTIEYEALVEDYHRQIQRVLEFLGLDASPARTIPPPVLVRQSDALTLEWRELLQRDRYA